MLLLRLKGARAKKAWLAAVAHQIPTRVRLLPRSEVIPDLVDDGIEAEPVAS
jgi:hypothetical protein